MLTWRDFYQTLGIDLGTLEGKPYNNNIILVYDVDIINQVRTFLISNGFRINSTLPWSSIEYTPSFFSSPRFSYSLCKISFGTNDSCCFCNKPLNIYDLLIYLASQIYFFNTTASFFGEFRVFTGDGYDVSIVKNEGDNPMLCIGNKNQFVNECFYSELRFALNSGTTSK
jgi:hypothetical protein